MFCQPGCDQWLATLRTHLPQLSKPQATVLALWSVGRVLALSCAMSAVSAVLAKGLKRKDQTVRHQLREWCYDAKAKRGRQRQALRVETCFPVLLAWVVRWWHGTQLALASDATSLGTRFVVLAISVVYRGGAIPVAWVVLEAGKKQAGRREWRRRRRKLRPAIPKGWTVIVLADRGLYAPWLVRRLRKLGWHPFLRINNGGTFRPAGQPCLQPLPSFVPQPGTRWRGRGTALQTTGGQLECTLLACWEEGYTDPWLLRTDLPPAASDAGWYGLRAGIEQGFKITKRAGGQWHRTRMTDPARAARLWLAVAVAPLGVLSVGGEADEAIPASPLLDVTGRCSRRPRSRRATRRRLVSVFRQGWLTVLVALLCHELLPEGCFMPDPWPVVPPCEDEAREPVLAMPDAA
jgi:hypothetical protein